MIEQDCGTPLYGDFSKDNPGELEILKSSLTGGHVQPPAGSFDSESASGTELVLVHSATSSTSAISTAASTQV